MVGNLNERVNTARPAVQKLGAHPSDEEVQKIVEDESISNFDLCYPVRIEYEDENFSDEEKYWAGIILTKRGYLWTKEVLVYLLLWLRNRDAPASKEIFAFVKAHNYDPFMRHFTEQIIRAANNYEGIEKQWIESLKEVLKLG